MPVASGSLLSPETQSPRALPKPPGLATKSLGRAGGHGSLCWRLLPCSVLITHPQSSQTSTRGRRGGTVPCRAVNISVGVDKSAGRWPRGHL